MNSSALTSPTPYELLTDAQQLRWDAFVNLRSHARRIIRELLNSKGTVRDEVRREGNGKNSVRPVLRLENEAGRCWNLHGGGVVEVVAKDAVPPALTTGKAATRSMTVMQFQQGVLPIVEGSSPRRALSLDASWQTLTRSVEALVTALLRSLLGRYESEIELLGGNVSWLRYLTSDAFALVTFEEAARTVRARRGIPTESSTSLHSSDERELLAHVGNIPTFVMYEYRTSRVHGEVERYISADLLFPKIGSLVTIGLIAPSQRMPALISNDGAALPQLPVTVPALYGGAAISLEAVLGLLLQTKLF